MGVWCLEFSWKRTTLWQIYWGLLQKTATISQVYHNNNQQCVTMVKEIQNKHIIMVPRQFSSLLMTMLPFSLLEGDDSFTITHPFYSFRFCVINHGSAPKLLSLISATYPLDTIKAHTVPYSELRHLWDSLAPSVHTHFSVIQLVPDNSVHYPVNVHLSVNISSWTCLYTTHHL